MNTSIYQNNLNNDDYDATITTSNNSKPKLMMSTIRIMKVREVIRLNPVQNGQVATLSFFQAVENGLPKLGCLGFSTVECFTLIAIL